MGRAEAQVGIRAQGQGSVYGQVGVVRSGLGLSQIPE